RDHLVPIHEEALEARIAAVIELRKGCQVSSEEFLLGPAVAFAVDLHRDLAKVPGGDGTMEIDGDLEDAARLQADGSRLDAVACRFEITGRGARRIVLVGGDGWIGSQTAEEHRFAVTARVAEADPGTGTILADARDRERRMAAYHRQGGKRCKHLV